MKEKLQKSSSEVSLYIAGDKKTHFFKIDVNFPQEPYNTHRSSCPKASVRAWDYKIFPLNHLGDLINIIGEHNSRKSKMRYVVDTDYRIWFALEGSPNKHIPGHGQMINKVKTQAKCITAGNIFIKEGKLELINNKTGDFLAHFNSVTWALAILLKHENELPSEFLPQTIHIQNTKPEQRYAITKEELKNYLQPYVLSPKIAVSQVGKIKEEQYQIADLNNCKARFFPSQFSQLSQVSEVSQTSQSECRQDKRHWGELADDNENIFKKAKTVSPESSESAQGKEVITMTNTIVAP